jgi:prepilin-type N-terminal cleavage/methylation domain-containing protein
MRLRLKNERGISMLEMMIAVVVIGLLAAISVPNFSGAIRKMKFDNEGRDMVSSLRFARSAAITLQQPVGVLFNTDAKKVMTFIDRVNPGGNTYEIGDSLLRTDSLETSVSYFGTTFAGQVVVFQPDGRASAGGYVMAYAPTGGGGTSRSFTIGVTAGSGRVRLDYYN